MKSNVKANKAKIPIFKRLESDINPKNIQVYSQKKPYTSISSTKARLPKIEKKKPLTPFHSKTDSKNEERRSTIAKNRKKSQEFSNRIRTSIFAEDSEDLRKRREAAQEKTERFKQLVLNKEPSSLRTTLATRLFEDSKQTPSPREHSKIEDVKLEEPLLSKISETSAVDEKIEEVFNEVSEIILKEHTLSTVLDLMKKSSSISIDELTNPICEDLPSATSASKKGTLSNFKTMSENMFIDDFMNKTLGTNFKFKLQCIIAETSNSVIYKAISEDNKEVAIKRSHDSKEYINLLKSEFEVYNKVNHTNIATCLGYEVVNNSHFLALEYCKIGSLRDLIDQGRVFSESDTLKIAFSILCALVELHGKGIIHRDIKCANILLDNEGVCKLADFGHSVVLEGSTEDLPPVDCFKGTLFWMAPEVILQKVYNTKADIWSFGCAMLELVTGKNPWPKFDNYFEAMNVIARTNEVPDIPYETTDSLKDFLEKCFKKNPHERSSAEDLLAHSIFSAL